jgi:dihydroorotate dehydrogenase
MKNWIVAVRNSLVRFFYVNLLKPIYFRQDPEDVHDAMTRMGEWLGRWWVLRKTVSSAFSFSHSMLAQDILGIHFSNPIGLAAGFDKDALLTDILPSVGFGYEEVGSITGEPCEGNPKPRLWRLPKSSALVVYYGLKNEGSEKVAARLRNKKFKFPIGTSIAKTNSVATVDTQAGINDYVKAFREFVDIGDYFTVNISCPNAFGGEPFTDPVKLEGLLAEVDKIPTKKPIFIKLSPDLSEEQLTAVLDVCARHRVQGFISSNLTKKRDNKNILEKDVPAQGGISGRVVMDLSNAQIRFIYKKTGGKYIIVGCGGIFTAHDAYEKIKAGASLLQLITGMIFEGPQAVGEINRGLVELLKKDGHKNISEAIGTE